MAKYDPSVIRNHADALYATAAMNIIVFTGGGLILGGVPLLLLGKPMEALLVAAILGFGGYFVGASRAASLRLAAQAALCQVQIEMNTRASREGTTATSAEVASTPNDPSTSPASASIADPVCPKCREQYREGFTVCTDCGVPLVSRAELAAARARSLKATEAALRDPEGAAEAADVCPNCGGRYPSGVEKCPACQLDLISETA